EGGAASAKKNEALSYLEQLLTRPPAAAQSTPAPAAPRRAASIESLAQSAPQSRTTSGGGGTWSRVELEPGLELHVHDQYRPPREAKGLRRLTQLVMRVIESQGQKPGK
ncbi:MAG TPA: hypothetical protein VN256_06425, partial [Pyrinomonadaceae bacterium]|nr:hypothetical protein [Pyrinomonadaceae bacterium]